MLAKTSPSLQHNFRITRDREKPYASGEIIQLWVEKHSKDIIKRTRPFSEQSYPLLPRRGVSSIAGEPSEVPPPRNIRDLQPFLLHLRDGFYRAVAQSEQVDGA